MRAAGERAKLSIYVRFAQVGFSRVQSARCGPQPEVALRTSKGKRHKRKCSLQLHTVKRRLVSVGLQCGKRLQVYVQRLIAWLFNLAGDRLSFLAWPARTRGKSVCARRPRIYKHTSSRRATYADVRQLTSTWEPFVLSANRGLEVQHVITLIARSRSQVWAVCCCFC